MTDIRELLTLAARAMGLEIEPCTCSDVPFRLKGERFHWCPDRDDGDCARMCAALGISTYWHFQLGDPTRAIRFVVCATREHRWERRLKDHNNDRAAAWRLAALRVAAEIGKGVQG